MYHRTADVPFEALTRLLQSCAGSSTKGQARQQLREFRETYIPRQAGDAFEVYRLLLPKVRGAPRRCILLPGPPLIPVPA
jgi:hypothetical protein